MIILSLYDWPGSKSQTHPRRQSLMKVKGGRRKTRGFSGEEREESDSKDESWFIPPLFVLFAKRVRRMLVNPASKGGLCSCVAESKVTAREGG